MIDYVIYDGAVCRNLGPAYVVSADESAQVLERITDGAKLVVRDNTNYLVATREYALAKLADACRPLLNGHNVELEKLAVIMKEVEALSPSWQTDWEARRRQYEGMRQSDVGASFASALGFRAATVEERNRYV